MNKQAALYVGIGAMLAGLHNDYPDSLILLIWFTSPIILITLSLYIGSVFIGYIERKENERWGRE
jgi:phosphate/sulfate permease